MSADFEDWTRGLELVTDDMSDFPDWTVAAQVTGGSAGGYASLTGPGQTTTPGLLDQAGGFDITSGDNLFSLDAPGGGSGNLVATVTNSATITAPGFTLDTNVAILTTSLAGVELTTDPGFDFIVNGMSSTEEIGVSYGIGGSGVTTSPGITFEDAGTGTTIGMFVFAGNPNGHITLTGTTHGVCFDTATPAMWGWKTGTLAWVVI